MDAGKGSVLFGLVIVLVVGLAFILLARRSRRIYEAEYGPAPRAHQLRFFALCVVGLLIMVPMVVFWPTFIVLMILFALLGGFGLIMPASPQPGLRRDIAFAAAISSSLAFCAGLISSLSR